MGLNSDLTEFWIKAKSYRNKLDDTQNLSNSKLPLGIGQCPLQGMPLQIMLLAWAMTFEATWFKSAGFD